eukprot:gnl/MRDRNA2_/MRDRNA2_81124_c0_seq1.p1 gnl/MRDRNA2_/MRDRNA2_81124_c0~~gnl/MRDRNA2_/MRDRNA2_81124_c0_seq1.p1  ORF type:complete len:1019 (-),score=213.27 gnl/MRDRNA2_/MRDRNA2_81124_c0_seq1:35-2992(-)
MPSIPLLPGGTSQATAKQHAAHHPSSYHHQEFNVTRTKRKKTPEVLLSRVRQPFFVSSLRCCFCAWRLKVKEDQLREDVAVLRATCAASQAWVPMKRSQDAVTVCALHLCVALERFKDRATLCYLWYNWLSEVSLMKASVWADFLQQKDIELHSQQARVQALHSHEEQVELRTALFSAEEANLVCRQKSERNFEQEVELRTALSTAHEANMMLQQRHQRNFEQESELRKVLSSVEEASHLCKQKYEQNFESLQRDFETKMYGSFKLQEESRDVITRLKQEVIDHESNRTCDTREEVAKNSQSQYEVEADALRKLQVEYRNECAACLAQQGLVLHTLNELRSVQNEDQEETSMAHDAAKSTQYSIDFESQIEAAEIKLLSYEERMRSLQGAAETAERRVTDARIFARSEQAALKIAQGEVEHAESKLSWCETHLYNIQDTAESCQSVSWSDFESSEAKLSRCEASLQALQAQYDTQVGHVNAELLVSHIALEQEATKMSEEKSSCDKELGEAKAEMFLVQVVCEQETALALQEQELAKAGFEHLRALENQCYEESASSPKRNHEKNETGALLASPQQQGVLSPQSNGKLSILLPSPTKVLSSLDAKEGCGAENLACAETQAELVSCEAELRALGHQYNADIGLAKAELFVLRVSSEEDQAAAASRHFSTEQSLSDAKDLERQQLQAEHAASLARAENATSDAQIRLADFESKVEAAEMQLSACVSHLRSVEEQYEEENCGLKAELSDLRTKYESSAYGEGETILACEGQIARLCEEESAAHKLHRKWEESYHEEASRLREEHDTAQKVQSKFEESVLRADELKEESMLRVDELKEKSVLAEENAILIEQKFSKVHERRVWFEGETDRLRTGEEVAFEKLSQCESHMFKAEEYHSQQRQDAHHARLLAMAQEGNARQLRKEFQELHDWSQKRLLCESAEIWRLSKEEVLLRLSECEKRFLHLLGLLQRFLQNYNSLTQNTLAISIGA